MSTIDDKKAKIIDDYISKYCDIDLSKTKKWYIPLNTICHDFKVKMQTRVGVKSLARYINNNYKDIIKKPKRTPLMVNNKVETKKIMVLENLILTDEIEVFENYFKKKEEEKKLQRENEKTIMISDSSHEALKGLFAIGQYKSMSMKIEIILNNYINNKTDNN